MDLRERLARAICTSCEEDPDHSGDCRGNEFRWQDYLPCADAVMDVLQEQRPNGWRLVPPEPTEEMIDAAMQSDAVDYINDDIPTIARLDTAYKAMIAAAPRSGPENAG